MELLRRDDVPGWAFRSPLCRISVWVHWPDGYLPSVYDEKTDLCEEIWFEFRQLTCELWERMIYDCVDTEVPEKYRARLSHRDGAMDMYDLVRLDIYRARKFALRHMLAGTNAVENLSYGPDGGLTDESMEDVYRIHPRILDAAMRKHSIFPDRMDDAERAEIDRQCQDLFMDRGTVKNPHPWVSFYCNAVSLWDKLGMTVKDTMSLPFEAYNALSYMVGRDNHYTSESMKKETGGGGPTGRSQHRQLQRAGLM